MSKLKQDYEERKNIILDMYGSHFIGLIPKLDDEAKNFPLLFISSVVKFAYLMQLVCSAASVSEFLTKEKARLFELRKRSKQGEKLAGFDLKFVKRCYDEDPAYFDVIEARVFEEIKPFGAA